MVVGRFTSFVNGLRGDAFHFAQNMHWTTRVAWMMFGAIGFTWFLFQKKLLPKKVSMVVSKLYFLPTFPITALLRTGNYWTEVDNTLILGCAPMGFLNHPKMMHDMGVKGVINMCYEYEGPKDAYAQLGMRQLYLPTVDHFEPSLESMQAAVRFIEDHKQRGEKVYVHCKAAHGRAASIALCWMLNQNPKSSLQELNSLLSKKRKVRKTLYQQENVMRFAKIVQG